jgi:hypothetical protein
MDFLQLIKTIPPHYQFLGFLALFLASHADRFVKLIWAGLAKIYGTIVGLGGVEGIKTSLTYGRNGKPSAPAEIPKDPNTQIPKPAEQIQNLKLKISNAEAEAAAPLPEAAAAPGVAEELKIKN